MTRPEWWIRLQEEVSGMVKQLTAKVQALETQQLEKDTAQSKGHELQVQYNETCQGCLTM